MSLPDWEEEASAQKSLLNLGRNEIKKRSRQRDAPTSIGTGDGPSQMDAESRKRETGFDDKLTPLLAGDRLNVLLLLFLYILQGIPLGKLYQNTAKFFCIG